MVQLLGTYTEDNASQARDDAHKYVEKLAVSVIYVNENENGEKRENNKFVNEN